MKVALAARLRAETMMTAGWIAERLALGTRGYLNHLLSCIAGGSWAVSSQYQELTPLLGTRGCLNHLLYRQRKLGGE